MSGLLAELEKTMGSIELTAATESELVALTSQLHRGVARIEGYLTRVARELRAREAAGSGPPAEDVLRDDGSVSTDRAGAVKDRAGLADSLPGLGASAESGATRTENADAVARAVARLGPAERARLAASDREITRRAAIDSPEVFGLWLRRKLREIAEPAPADEKSAAEREKDASTFAMGRRPTGRWWLSGDMDHERSAEINDLVNRRARLLAGEGPVGPHHRAAALHQLITGGAGAGCGPGRSGGPASSRMGVGYVVDARTLFRGAHEGTVSETWGGDGLDPRAAQRLACDADLYAILLDELGRPEAVGRTRRHATREQRLALRALYRTCPIDGATPFDRCEIHHVNTRFEHGGVTELHNLVPVSQEWHHRIHDRGWVLTMLPDRTLELSRPDGTHYRTIPPPTPITRQRE